jgi:cold shock CspA family protein
MYGTITYFNNARGFGFITTTEGNQFFFHINNLAKGEAPPVLEGRVRFDVGPAIAVGKKPQAINVQYCRNKPTDVKQEGGINALSGGVE